ncbi:fluoride efflux transporter FluC [Anatilimnocola floriformis]|uniref:fluoride efflux transporter FluC n=1 Tax=Anatilimnocola floriformis TaxID=2948575 RepID=UPI0020C3C337|nr:CrcB family protein [Anatilimnocola floriformis]
MNYLRDITLVFLCGGLGSFARYGLGISTQYLLGKSFPWGTLTANLIGCLIIGFVGQRVAQLEPPGNNPALAHLLRVAVMVGFLGGLTTFSAFGWESVSRLVDKNSTQQFIGLANIGANLGFGLLLVWVGMQLAKLM